MSASPPDFQVFTSLRYDPILLQSSANTSLNGGTPSPFYMLSHHRDRLLQAATYFNWPSAISSINGPSGLIHLQNTITTHIGTSSSSSPLRIKAILDINGTLTIESNGTPAVPLCNLYPSHLPAPSEAQDPPASTCTSPSTTPTQLTPYKIHPDPHRTTASSFTTYKTTSRDMYDLARSRAGIATFTSPAEVLIISSKEGEIMEGSLTTVYLWRGGRWATPPTGEWGNDDGRSSGGQHGTTRRWLLENGLCGVEVVGVDSLMDGEECWISNGVKGFIWGRVVLDSGAGVRN